MSDGDFVTIYLRFFSYVLAGCLERLGDQYRAQDAAQEVWIAFWDSYDPLVGPPQPFLSTLVSIKSADLWREEFHRSTVPASRLENPDDEEGDLFEILLSELSYHPQEFDPEFRLSYLEFLDQVEKVLEFIQEQGEIPVNAVNTLLVAGRRLPSIGGGTTGEEAPQVLSLAQSSALRHLRRKLKERFTYWHDPWGATCDICSIQEASP